MTMKKKKIESNQIEDEQQQQQKIVSVVSTNIRVRDLLFAIFRM